VRLSKLKENSEYQTIKKEERGTIVDKIPVNDIKVNGHGSCQVSHNFLCSMSSLGFGASNECHWTADLGVTMKALSSI
jgi:hypothetical protein